jgi:hypothetical protein
VPAWPAPPPLAPPPPTPAHRLGHGRRGRARARGGCRRTRLSLSLSLCHGRHCEQEEGGRGRGRAALRAVPRRPLEPWLGRRLLPALRRRPPRQPARLLVSGLRRRLRARQVWTASLSPHREPRTRTARAPHAHRTRTARAPHAHRTRTARVCPVCCAPLPLAPPPCREGRRPKGGGRFSLTGEGSRLGGFSLTGEGSRLRGFSLDGRRLPSPVGACVCGGQVQQRGSGGVPGVRSGPVRAVAAGRAARWPAPGSASGPASSALRQPWGAGHREGGRRASGRRKWAAGGEGSGGGSGGSGGGGGRGCVGSGVRSLSGGPLKRRDRAAGRRGVHRWVGVAAVLLLLPCCCYWHRPLAFRSSHSLCQQIWPFDAALLHVHVPRLCCARRHQHAPPAAFRAPPAPAPAPRVPAPAAAAAAAVCTLWG